MVKRARLRRLPAAIYTYNNCYRYIDRPYSAHRNRTLGQMPSGDLLRDNCWRSGVLYHIRCANKRVQNTRV